MCKFNGQIGQSVNRYHYGRKYNKLKMNLKVILLCFGQNGVSELMSHDIYGHDPDFQNLWTNR